MVKQVPEFDSRNYGYKKLVDLVSAITLFEIDRRSQGTVYIRNKRGKLQP
ncbi:MAG: OST-HTH/LOTUS domain-containing protein [Candidatus Competibacteraceae bacterium]|nr:MAG: OST-HTH/LOTUS domain-containing protein [Candidatus Competibacteraceae bacterium]